tara:strand:+ start:15665 stop:16411 length:747 start_codon:yes stop_codon:yes gene_type:complete
MATYKKRAIKSRSAKRSKDIESTKQVFDTLDVSASKTETFVNQYQNYIIGTILSIIVIFSIYFAYDKFIIQPKTAESNLEIFTAQKYFDLAMKAEENKDSLFNLALNGAEGKFGFLDIIENYSGTDASNLSYYSAGMSYYNMKRYDLAIEMLENFSSDDEILQSLSLATIGDAFIQLNQFEDGLNYYESALSYTQNSFIRPVILLKAGDLAKQLDKLNRSAKYFQEIKEDFPKSNEANLIDIRLEQVK